MGTNDCTEPSASAGAAEALGEEHQRAGRAEVCPEGKKGRPRPTPGMRESPLPTLETRTPASPGRPGCHLRHRLTLDPSTASTRLCWNPILLSLRCGGSAKVRGALSQNPGRGRGAPRLDGGGQGVAVTPGGAGGARWRARGPRRLNPRVREI